MNGAENETNNQVNLGPAVALAILGGAVLGCFLLIRQLPSQHLSRADMQRLLFYRYLRQKGKLES
jgi:hypothetical protein